MPKRFTDSNKYKKPFLRSLKGAYKLFWDYICNDCDHAGIWIVDFQIAQIYIGEDMPVNREDALKYFNEDETRIIEFDNGKKWFIKPFVEFQYGELNEANRVHNSVINELKKYNLFDFKGHSSPFNGAKDKDKEKDKDKGQRQREKQAELFNFFNLKTEAFKESWNEWIDYRKQLKLKPLTEKGIKMQLKFLSEQPDAVAVINQSIQNQWQGLFPLKQKSQPPKYGQSDPATRQYKYKVFGDAE